MDDLLDDFLEETNENLDALTNDLVAWEKNPVDRRLFDGIFRFFHTIKGNSGFLELQRLGYLSHAAETALAQVRDKGVVPDSSFVSAIFAAIDQIRVMLQALAETRAEPAGNDAALIGLLEAATIIVPRLPESCAAPQGGGPQAGASGATAANAFRAHSGTVRVSIALLDRLMGIASELVLARNALLRSTRHGEEIPANLIEHVSTCVTDLQDGINRTRMQPIEALWTPLPRLVRDLGQELAKDMDLVLEGGDTEIDRQLLEVIRDPITHMVRNAADHGLESPDMRRRLGKPAKGTIKLSALQSGGHIHIDLSDDGRGIDPDRLRARAIAMGLLDAAEAETLSESAAQALIFEPGLSTAASVTAISGRGVGMDVVRSNLERIGGSVEVRSRVGHGSSFLIRVPLTLTIVPALIVGVDGRSYAIAQSSIREIVRLKDMNALKTVGGRSMIELRNTFIPVIDMAGMFGTNVPPGAERWGVIIDAAGMGRVVLLVDAVSDQEEIVIKPVAPLIAATGVYAGTTVLGNGEAALVLDLPGVVERAGIGAGAAIEENVAVADNTIDAGASWMLFETGSGAMKALPLALVARIESLDRTAVSLAGGHWVLRHEDRLLPLNSLDGEPGGDLALILDDGRGRVALPVMRVVDIVSTALTIERPALTPGIAGVAALDGASVEVVDSGWLMSGAGTGISPMHGSILIVGNRQFSISLLKPLLESAGHSTFVAADKVEAQALIDGGMTFDLVLADDGEPASAENNQVKLRLASAVNGSAGEGIDPYDRAGLLEAVNGSLRRRAAEVMQ